MPRFTWLSLCTIYSCKNLQGCILHRMERDVCFHTVIKDHPYGYMENQYKIIIFKGPKYLERTDSNNYCPLTIKEVRNYLSALKKYFKFSYSVSEKKVLRGQCDYLRLSVDEYRDYKYYELNLTIKGSMLVHKFILKMVRALYEFPYNMEMKDVLRIVKLPMFKKYGIVNLYRIVGVLLYRLGAGGSHDQFIGNLVISNLPTRKELQNKIQSIGDRYYQINDIFTYRQSTRSYEQFIQESLRLYLKFTAEEYWDNQFSTRLELYKKVIKFYE